MREDRSRNVLGIVGGIAVVLLALLFVAGLVLHLYPAERLGWAIGDRSQPVVVTAVAEGEGEWDSPIAFWAAYQGAGSDDLSSVPAEYSGLLLPRRPAEYIFIGGSQPWRGLRITLDAPNTVSAHLVAEHWDGQVWRKNVLDGTYRNYATLNVSGKITFSTGVGRTLVVDGQAVWAYWVRLSVESAKRLDLDWDLSDDLAGRMVVLHYSPVALRGNIEVDARRLTACENRPGLKMIRLTVVDKNGDPVPDVKVGFDVEDSDGIAYDHPNVFGYTDENGYIEWDHFGVPTIYGIWINGTQAVGNIHTDFGYEYCRPAGTVLGGWIPVNKPGVYSWTLKITVK